MNGIDKIDNLNKMKNEFSQNCSSYNEETKKFIINTVLKRSKDQRLYFPENESFSINSVMQHIAYLDFSENDLFINIGADPTKISRINFDKLILEEKINIVNRINKKLIYNQLFLREEYLIRQRKAELSIAKLNHRNQLLSYIRKLLKIKGDSHKNVSFDYPVTVETDGYNKEILNVFGLSFPFNRLYVHINGSPYKYTIEQLNNESLNKIINKLKEIK